MTDLQAIRERAERFLAVDKKMGDLCDQKNNKALEEAIWELDDICREDGPTICRDLLAALDREKVLEGEVRILGSIRDTAWDAVATSVKRAEAAEARLATLQTLAEEMAKSLAQIREDRHATQHKFAGRPIPIRNSTLENAFEAEREFRATFPATPKGEEQ